MISFIYSQNQSSYKWYWLARNSMLANVTQWNEQLSAQKSGLSRSRETHLFEQIWVESPTQYQQTAPISIAPSIPKKPLLAKRIFDIAVTLALMPVALPMMVLVALAIKLDSKGDIIFPQTRVGRFGQSFTCFKFRSMRYDAEEIKQALAEENEASGPIFKMKRDPRITRVGRIIRKLSLDELPQLFNVLLGDMSLVGPRPPIPSEVVEYAAWQYGRLATIPGLTGLQQVSGRSDLDFDRWVELDLEYIRTQSFWNDILILLKTIPAVVTGKGAY